MVEIQNTLNVTAGRLDIAKEMASEYEDRLETIQNETQIKINKKHLKSINQLCNTLCIYLYICT